VPTPVGDRCSLQRSSPRQVPAQRSRAQASWFPQTAPSRTSNKPQSAKSWGLCVSCSTSPEARAFIGNKQGEEYEKTYRNPRRTCRSTFSGGNPRPCGDRGSRLNVSRGPNRKIGPAKKSAKTEGQGRTATTKRISRRCHQDHALEQQASYSRARTSQRNKSRFLGNEETRQTAEHCTSRPLQWRPLSFQTKARRRLLALSVVRCDAAIYPQSG
jgi:hypothetical protein